MANSQSLAIPMKLDAFVFNPKVCEGDEMRAKIAPITQPNYTFLRVTDHLAQNDIMDPVDLHNAWPATSNPRLTDLARGTIQQHRLGVYLHWMIPRLFRSGVAATPTANGSKDGSDKDTRAPVFPRLPNRWLVIRKLDPNASTTSPQGTSIPAVQAWVIESDKTYSIDDLGPDVDLQVDVSPFITSYIPEGQAAESISVARQAEIFIGKRTDAMNWPPKRENLNGDREKNANGPEPPPDDRQRVNLTAASSSNQLFLDFQYHNGNVLSMLDNFAYSDPEGNTKYLTSADASYYVLGWQSIAGEDVMDKKTSESLPNRTRRSRLEALGLVLNEALPDADTIKAWLDAEDSAQSLCHAALYDVNWSIDELPQNRPADVFAKSLVDEKKRQVALGTTPIDSILAYVSSHSSSDETESRIAKLQTLLRAADDSVDSYVAAEDEVQSYNYAHFDGGSIYYHPGVDGQSGDNVGNEPSDDDQRKLRTTNAAQRLYDACLRRRKQIRWELFSWWWKSISDIDEAGNIANTVDTIDYASKTKDLADELGDLNILIEQLPAKVIKDPKPPIKMGVVEDFHQRNDPTLMLAGLESAWPKDFSKKLDVRLPMQIIQNEKLPELLKEFGVGCLPTGLDKIGDSLVREFLTLATFSKGDEPSPENSLFPIYHDGKYAGELEDKKPIPISPDNPWRDRFMETQPWFPLYLEWEAEYIHIPWDKWSFTKRPSKKQRSVVPFAYTLVGDVETKLEDRDSRIASGRTLILPQPGFSLKLQLERLFDTLPESALNEYLSKDERDKLLAALNKLAFLSTPLAGLTDHLITRMQGSHIKPLVRVPGRTPLVLTEVADIAAKIGITKRQLKEIDAESDPTPYGSVASIVGNKLCAFKAVTHGQMRITKLNVVDKFGQTAHALNPKAEDPGPLYPNVGEFLSIDPLSNSNIPNVIDRTNSKTLDKSEFIQLSPCINQPARINAYFLEHGDMENGEGKWRPSSEWRSPIWGWIVINYVDNGIQFFLPDGTFYREVRVTIGAASDIKWLPFEPPQESGSSNTQLDALISRMTAPEEEGQKYLRAFMNMISDALQSVTPAPTAYSQFMNSLVGRPLALANMGWSLELASKPYANQSTIKGQREDVAPPQRNLIRDRKNPDRAVYEFPIKLGDRSRNYDGLIGYFNLAESAQSDGKGDLNLDHIYTYFGMDKDQPVNGSDILQPIDGKPYPLLKPWWQNPWDYFPKDGKEESYVSESKRYERERYALDKMNVYGALFDPFSPITGFSSILPVRTLTLPNWTWESALKKMTTFFHAGPLILPSTTKLAAWAEDRRLDEKYVLNDKATAGVVELPALQAADWNWLQPYEDKGYMAFGILKQESKAAAEDEEQQGPMTAVEGFLQLRNPVEREKPLEEPVSRVRKSVALSD